VQIDHITFSKTGGAGLVAQTIAKAQMDLGHDVKVLTILESDLRSQPTRRPLLTFTAALDEWLVSSREETTLLSCLRGGVEALDVAKIRPGSIVHLHWMAGVMKPLTVKNLLESERKVVWTLHDMNPFSGGCHYSHGCTGYTNGCTRCPQARKIFQSKIHLNLEQKKLIRPYSNLRIVSPTRWMDDQSRNSSVFRGQSSVVIPNPVEKVFFSQTKNSHVRDRLHIQESRFVGLVVAKDLREPRKNIDFVIRALEKVSESSGQAISILLIGQNGRDYQSNSIDVLWLGELDSVQVSEASSAADVLLSGSTAESAGMTIVECAAMGIPSVAMKNGGTENMIHDGQTGLLADDFDSFVAKTIALVNNRTLLAKLGDSARASALRYQPNLIARQYLDIYKSMD
jgi:glycosyltransferase involved in cell wall biosynthesis